MSTINDTDQFLVQRGSNSRKQNAVNLMSTIQDTDVMLVQRGTESYKVSCKDVKDQLGAGADISVGKGQITPSADVEEGMTLTGSADVSGNIDPTVYIHQWYVNGALQEGIQTNTFTAVQGTVTYKLCVTDAKNPQAVCGAMSDAVTVTAATTPTATMHGLRFDAARQTYLTRNLSNIKNWTWSCWFKRTANGSTPDRMFVLTDEAGKYLNFQVEDANKVFFIAASSPPGGVSSETGTEMNTWDHFCASWDYENNYLKAWVNGVEVISTNKDYRGILSRDLIAYIGRDHNSADQFTNGYMSDMYFVEQTLEPTTFGKFFEGKWGPLDGSVVLQNIGDKESPSDSLPNMAEKWSSFWTGTTYQDAPYSFENVHDADIAQVGEAAVSSNCVLGEQGSTLVFIPSSPILVNTSVSLRVIDGGGSGNDKLFMINEGTVYEKSWNAAPAGTGLQDLTVSASDIGGAIHNIKLDAIGDGGGNSAYLAAVFVDGRPLVDGPADNSQAWSEYATGQPYTGGVKEHAFDGDLTTEAAPADGTTMTFVPSEELVGQVTIIARGGDQNTQADLLTVNGIDYTVTLNQQGPSGQVYEFNVGQGSINNTQGVTWSRAAAGGINFCHIYGIKVAGKLLVDGAATWNTSQVWSADLSFLGAAGSPATNAFDGSLSTSADSTTSGDTRSNAIVFTPTGGLDYTEGVKVHCPIGQLSARLNGGDWVDFSTVGVLATGSGTINTIEVTEQRKEATFGVSAYEVDGDLLVDRGSFGANGFYLPFKSDLPSQNLVVGFTDTTSISTTPNLFNGAIIGYSETAIAWSCSADVPGSGVQWYQSDDGIEWIYQGTANDGPFNSTFDSVPSKWMAAGGSGTNARTIASTNGETFGWTQWEVDDRFDKKANTTISNAPWFVPINSIGIDGSGQGNHFTGENFAAGNTAEVWSKDLGEGFGGGYPAQWAFNYDKSDLVGATNSSITAPKFGYVISDVQVVVPINQPVVNNFGFVSLRGGGATLTVLATASDGTIEDLSPQLTSTAFVSQALSTAFAGKTLQSISILSSNAGSYVAGILIDGDYLIDANVQDTVTDTPVTDYAVIKSDGALNLSSASNGNLQYEQSSGTNWETGKIANVLVDGGKYYWEQIFVKGRGMYGIVDASVSFNSGENAADASVSTIYYSDGTLYHDGSTVGQPGSNPISPGTVVGCAVDFSTNNIAITFYFNGSLFQKIDNLRTDKVYQIAICLNAQAGDSESVYNFGQQSWIYGPEAGYTGIYQTWSEWTSALLMARVQQDEARISQLEEVIRDQAVPFSMDSVYPKGAIVDMVGELYEAQVDGADVRASDFLARLFRDGSDEWMKLNISTDTEFERPERPEKPTTLPALPEDEDVSTMSVEERAERRRARNADGTFRGDDPSTPDINEAWEDGEA